MLSAQDGATQTSLHTSDAQSLATLQARPSAHAGQEPPQSTLVSFPFATPSRQVGAWHEPSAHTPLLQSSAVAQGDDASHGTQLLEPAADEPAEDEPAADESAPPLFVAPPSPPLPAEPRAYSANVGSENEQASKPQATP